jgi:hypothetical protein
MPDVTYSVRPEPHVFEPVTFSDPDTVVRLPLACHVKVPPVSHKIDPGPVADLFSALVGVQDEKVMVVLMDPVSFEQLTELLAGANSYAPASQLESRGTPR